MKTSILMMFVSNLFSLLSPKVILDSVESGLKWVEDFVTNTANEFDDAAVIPTINLIRMTLNMSVSSDSHQLKSMSAEMISNLLTNLFTLLSPDMIKGFIDSCLDVVENKIAGTETKIDDTFVLPIINLIRSTFDIPDNDTNVAVIGLV